MNQVSNHGMFIQTTPANSASTAGPDTNHRLLLVCRSGRSTGTETPAVLGNTTVLTELVVQAEKKQETSTSLGTDHGLLYEHTPCIQLNPTAVGSHNLGN